jgi:hypothetical protein
MSSAAAQSLDGAHVASVAVSVDEATPRARLLVDQVAVAANSEDLQLALVASELVAEASVVALVVAVVAVAALVVDSGVIEEVSEEDSVAEAADEVTLVVVVEVSATDLLMAPQLVPAVHEVVALAAIEEAEVGSEVTVVVEDDTRTDAAAVVVVVTTEDPAALTTNRSAAEIDTATAMVGTVEAETTAQGSAATKETATTTGASAADTRPTRWLKYLLQGFVKGYLPFPRLTLFRHEG